MASENGTPPETTVGAGKRKIGGSGRNRPRASLACENCRQRKIKCDAQFSGEKTTCTSCRSLKVLCVVTRDGDRRKAGSREQVASLQDRIKFLESFMKQSFQPHHDTVMCDLTQYNGQEMPNDSITVSAPVNDQTSQRRTSIAPGTSTSPGTAAQRSHLPHNSGEWADLISGQGQIDCSQQPQSVEGDTLQAIRTFVQESDSGTNVQLTSHSTNNQLSNYQQNTSNDLLSHGGDAGIILPPQTIPQPYPSQGIHADLERLTPPAEEDENRLDVDKDYGQPRFYGPTSQPYIRYAEVQPKVAASEESLDADNMVNMDSSTLRTLLFNIFWKAQPLSVTIIHEELFTTSRLLGRRSQYYSAFLENALLACATRMSTSDGVRKLGRKYAERAKLELSQELEDPNIASLQGFLLLSDFEATRGRDRLGYIYSGISCRLVFDLGLHEDCSKLVTQGKLSESEAKFRNILFLGAFVFDRLWSLYLGRPSSIPLQILFDSQRSASNASGSGIPTLDAWVGLCTHMSEVIDILNSASPLNQNSVDQLLEMDNRIRNCFDALPPALTCNENEISELNVVAYGLHIQFHGIGIVLHRLLSKAYSQQRMSDGLYGIDPGSPRSTTLQQSQTIMYTNAVRIARLVCVYYQTFGIENTITVMLDNMFVAATVIISHILELRHQNSTVSTERDVQWLRSLADMMQKGQNHYPVTTRMRDTLSSSVEGTTLAGIFGAVDGHAKVISNPTVPTVGMDGSWQPEGQQFLNQTESGSTFPEFGDRWFQDVDLNGMLY